MDYTFESEKSKNSESLENSKKLEKAEKDPQPTKPTRAPDGPTKANDVKDKDESFAVVVNCGGHQATGCALCPPQGLTG